jgi:hypothetical protein
MILPCPQCRKTDPVVERVSTGPQFPFHQFHCGECQIVFGEDGQIAKRPCCRYCGFFDQVSELVRYGEVIKSTDGTEYWICQRCGGELFETNTLLASKPKDELTRGERMKLYLMEHGRDLQVTVRKKS